ncbi:hypothetical protein RHMOL_Rhmol08G0190000 [Rhododendron molle]|uniref:Uncharacterized protein n=1 Tax=Rhododendron molle TaxID=49168 RepID=A0ACC0MRE1_RHOML|nr:hypothetical protein RHMOL_Rhmol08G0190000 [Rhododendron molle]
MLQAQEKRTYGDSARGDLDQSMEKLIDGDGARGAKPWRLTRVGEDERLKKLSEGGDEQKLALVEEA